LPPISSVSGSGSTNWKTPSPSPGFYDQPERAQELLREHKHLKSALEAHSEWQTTQKAISDNQALVEADEDEELTAMAQEELPELEERLERYHHRVMTALLPPDPNDSRNTIVEIRAGTGGDEAALFAADLFRMYQRYVERNGWKMEMMDSSPSEAGGYKEIIANITGEDVYKGFRFESGVHRVQRVPATESQGRIHTSAASVAVLPEAKEVDVEIKPDELQIDITRSGGPGGQGVNTTDSCVQITHKPSGIIVRCQDGRSQIKNKEKAMNILRSRLLEQKQAEEEAKYAGQRKQQIGSGDRSEKIRTYNFPQSRVTDHRIQFTTHNLDGVMDGDLEELVSKLQAEDVLQRLGELNQE
jgi:peptide chain release factor 1